MQAAKSSETKSRSKHKKKDNRKNRMKNSEHECNTSDKKNLNCSLVQQSKIQTHCLNVNRQNDENTSKITAAAALINDLGGLTEKSNTTVLTNIQKQNIQKILDKLFSTTISNQSQTETDTTLKSLSGGSKDVNQPSLLNEASTEDEDEHIEYVFKPRQYFMFSMCELCKKELKDVTLPCKTCYMTYYCNIQHMIDDHKHRTLCAALKGLADMQGGHIFNGTKNLSSELFRNFRAQMLKKCESILKRELELFEKEIILYPKICCEETCREWRYTHLTSCKNCKQIAYCKNNPSHLSKNHKEWCKSFSIMARIIQLQTMYGDIIPDMPNKVFINTRNHDLTMKNILNTLYEKEIVDDISFANITQLATGPLTAWYGLNMIGIRQKTVLNMHIVGAEFYFETNTLQKWEYFLFHLVPTLEVLNIIFIGPELFMPGISFDLLSKYRMCKYCRTKGRKIIFKFENSLYYEYYKTPSYIIPDLICFFNPGLHRFCGFENIDTWAETIRVSGILKCPVIVTSYTEYESPLDFRRFLMQTERPVEIIMPPIKNPFSSTKPERNFISDEIVPLIFKNFYCFIVQ